MGDQEGEGGKGGERLGWGMGRDGLAVGGIEAELGKGGIIGIWDGI